MEEHHDFDFVLELAVRWIADVDPVALITSLLNYLKGLDRYAEMTELKSPSLAWIIWDNYMDILPACRDGGSVEARGFGA